MALAAERVGFVYNRGQRRIHVNIRQPVELRLDLNGLEAADGLPYSEDTPRELWTELIEEINLNMDMRRIDRVNGEQLWLDSNYAFLEEDGHLICKIKPFTAIISRFMEEFPSRRFELNLKFKLDGLADRTHFVPIDPELDAPMIWHEHLGPVTLFDSDNIRNDFNSRCYRFVAVSDFPLANPVLRCDGREVARDDRIGQIFEFAFEDPIPFSRVDEVRLHFNRIVRDVRSEIRTYSWAIINDPHEFLRTSCEAII